MLDEASNVWSLTLPIVIPGNLALESLTRSAWSAPLALQVTSTTMPGRLRLHDVQCGERSAGISTPRPQVRGRTNSGPCLHSDGDRAARTGTQHLLYLLPDGNMLLHGGVP